MQMLGIQRAVQETSQPGAEVIAGGVDTASAATPKQLAGDEPQHQQVQGHAQQQQAAQAAAVPAEESAPSHHNGRTGVMGLWKQMQLGGSVLEVTRSQLGALAAAASTCGAVLGAVLVVLLRLGGGAAGAASR